jgi:hypothetical protein
VFIERVVADGQTFAVYQAPRAPSATNEAAPMELCNPGDKGELSLPPGLQQGQFEFTALSFVAPENVQFRYQLEGLDENWVDAGTRRVATYTHPPPGHYRFKVMACNNDGVWNTIGDTLPVAFAPYFWETVWFKLTVMLISFMALCGGVVLVRSCGHDQRPAGRQPGAIAGDNRSRQIASRLARRNCLGDQSRQRHFAVAGGIFF